MYLSLPKVKLFYYLSVEDWYMEQYNRLQVFDFDETFVRVPSYASKRLAENTEVRFNHPYDFYDHPNSLNDNVYNIQMVGPVYDAWKNGRGDIATVQALITHRVKGVKKEVMEILNRRSIHFNEYHFLGRKTPKVDEVQIMLDARPNIKVIEIYEDSIHQLSLYQEHFKTVRKYQVNLYLVDKSKMFKIDDIQISNAKKVVLI